MSVFKAMAGGGFLRGVLTTVLVVLLLSACGAALIVAGVWPVDRARLLIYIAWLLGAYAGGRSATVGEKGALWRCVFVSLIVVALLWLLGLTTPGSADMTFRLWCVGAALAGAVTAAAVPKKKRRKRRAEGRGKR